MIKEEVERSKTIRHNNNVKNSILIFTILTSFGIAVMIGSLFDKHVLAQTTMTDNEPTRINVQVTNNGHNDEIGSIHVISDETGLVKNSNDISFPAGQTVIQLFEFGADEIPQGTGFSVEVIYGDDDTKRVHGTNSQSSQPEIIDVVIS